MLNHVSSTPPQPTPMVPALLPRDPTPAGSTVSIHTERAPALPLTRTPTVPVTPGQRGLKAALGDRQNWQTLAQKLKEIVSRPGITDAAPAILKALSSTPMDLHPESSYPIDNGTAVTLRHFIEAHGLRVPSNLFELTALGDAASVRALPHPFGNFGGALSWPIPLDEDAQSGLLRRAARLVREHDDASHSGQPEGVLDFLRRDLPLTGETVPDPAKTLETLVTSSRGQALGTQLQTDFNAICTGWSASDYALAAIHLSLDPASIKASRRNTVAGFDLGQPQHWGKPASAVLQGLAAHLVATGKASAEMAHVGAYLLLMRRAPEFLIKDISPSVTYGSPAWVSLSIAAATQEARSPGTVANMTFAQVMLNAEATALANPQATALAQTSALLDWGVAHGVFARKPDSAYTHAEVEQTRATFNQQQTDCKEASASLDKDIPTRKAIALEKLKERFGDLGALFEEKLISSEGGGGTGQQTKLTGKHSLLDIAMMDLDDPAPFYSADSRVPLAALNANPRFGVRQVFDQQFDAAIQDRKTATSVSIKHLIAQLPLEDRNNLEYGEISFYQDTSHTLGRDFTSKYPDPNSQDLLVKTTRAGVTTAYGISLARGEIKSIPLHRVELSSIREANKVYETKLFTPAGSEPHHRRETTPLGALPPASFRSDRSHNIADAYIKHLDFDNPNVKSYARGQTTRDEQAARALPVEQFFLNLVPFRSAIVNFQKGNYGEGALDLSLDIFGFLTAGASTAGKLIKLGGSALSTGGKVLRATRLIGAAAIGTLNPLAGVGDAAVGTVGALGRGGRYLLSKGTEAVNLLKGASGNYNLLKAASNDNVVVATGMLNVAPRAVEGAAVLKNGQWYAFDVDRMCAYGGPLRGFTPATVATKGQINQSFIDWLYRRLAGDEVPTTASPTVLGQYVPKAFEAALETARRPNNIKDFEFGYAHGHPEKVPGYSSSMNMLELQTLASQRFLGPEDVGTLAKQIERQKVKLTQDGFMLFQRDIQAAGGTVTPMPQELYLSQVRLASEGECAGIANTLALALRSGDENIYLGNMFKAAAASQAPGAKQFIDNLHDFHQAVNGFETFHMGKPVRQIPYQEIAAELSHAAPPKTLRIATRDHALLAGVMTRDNKPVWFYFDPNFGLAKFDSADAMKNGLERTLNRGTSPFQHRALGEHPASPEYRVSDFDASDVSTYHLPAVRRMASVPL